MNRYIYDLSQSGGSANLKISDNTGTISGLASYGNLFKTQEYLPQTQNMQAQLSQLGQYQTASWSDVRGSSFDGLDRPVAKYELAYGTSAVSTNAYDCTNQVDLLCSAVNAVNQTTTYTYDNINRVKQVAFSGTAPVADGRAYTYDPDGRTATVADSMGTLSYTYDVDGNKTSVQEPSGEDAASFICYAYYADGLRAYLGVGMPGDSCGTNTNGIPQRKNPSNGGVSQPQLFSYAYRNDGMLANQQVNWLNNLSWLPQNSSGTGLFTWSYTPSERELSQTDPLNGASVIVPPNNTNFTLGTKTYSYDKYGRASSLTLPEGYQEGSLTYDTDDELVAYTTENGAQRQMHLNARGELISDGAGSPLTAQGATYMANGAQVGNGDWMYQGNFIQEPPSTLNYDVRSGMATCSTNPVWSQNQGIGAGAGNWVYMYDAAGRQIYAASDGNGSCSGSGTPTTTYDAANHIKTTSNLVGGFGATAQSGTINWGPDGRQRTDTLSGGGQSSTSAHWDGDTLLFAKYQGQPPQLYIGTMAVLDKAGDIEIVDRDQSGTQQAEHGGTAGAPNPYWFDSWGLGGVRSISVNTGKSSNPINVLLATGSCNFYGDQQHGYQYYGPCPFTYAPIFAMKRTDGYTMIGGVVQGARTYDPTSGQWLTPDADAGDVRDPMSQKPFMWNNNNPVEWSDPSGYCVEDAGIECAIGGAAVAEAALWVTAALAAAVGAKQLQHNADNARDKINRAAEGAVNRVMQALGGHSATGGPEHQPNRGNLRKASPSEARDVARRSGYTNRQGSGDPEALKKDYTGSPNTGQFDIYKDTSTGDYYILGKGGKGQPQPINTQQSPTKPY